MMIESRVKLPIHAQVAMMRAAGMSEQAIRRAIGGDPNDWSEDDDVHEQASDQATTPAGPWGPWLPSMEAVFNLVVRETGIDGNVLRGRQGPRKQPFAEARPRQVMMLLLRELTGATLPCIGWFVERDHSVVLRDIRRARALLEEDAELKALYDRVKHKVWNGMWE